MIIPIRPTSLYHHLAPTPLSLPATRPQDPLQTQNLSLNWRLVTGQSAAWTLKTIALPTLRSHLQGTALDPMESSPTGYAQSVVAI